MEHPRSLRCWRQGFSVLSLAASGWVVLLAGCGGKPATVSGIVTVDGKPLNQGTVGFSPVDGGLRAVGLIQSDGSYTLRTNRDEGLDVGEYAVTVVSREIVQSQAGQPPMPGKYLAPKAYGRAQTSGLRFEVEPGSNTIPIDLQASFGQAEGKTSRSRR